MRYTVTAKLFAATPATAAAFDLSGYVDRVGEVVTLNLPNGRSAEVLVVAAVVADGGDHVTVTFQSMDLPDPPEWIDWV